MTIIYITFLSLLGVLLALDLLFLNRGAHAIGVAKAHSAAPTPSQRAVTPTSPAPAKTASPLPAQSTSPQRRCPKPSSAG